MNIIVGVQFRDNTKVYYFASREEIILDINDFVVVETVRGYELGKVVKFVNEDVINVDFELKTIVRVATKEDINNYNLYLEKAKESLIKCKAIIKEFKLPMNLIKCDYTLDGTKIIFIYTSDDRVDFRGLLKELATTFKCRIELRQVGVRDKAKIVGDSGICGLPICCKSFLDKVGGISITMAKNQALSLNIQKLSGACGKLMCCLKYENDNYDKLRKIMPRIGDSVTFEKDNYYVNSINVISGEMRISNSEKAAFVNVKDVKINDRKSN